MKAEPVLIIGAGSAGERHIRNLWQLGYNNLLVYRQRNHPFRDIGGAQVQVFLDWQEVCAQQPRAAIICTPTAQHLPQVYDCIHAGMHMLVEKPLSHQLFDKADIINTLSENKLLLQVGYMLRYHPLLQEAKDFCDKQTFGKLINIQAFWGEYLPHWHPWEDYRQSYAASKAAGGGAALTLSHDLDIANWLAGALPLKHKTIHNYTAALEVDTDSAVDVLMAYPGNTSAHVHVNFCQKIPQRWYKLIFEEAVADIDYYRHSMSITTPGSIIEKKLDGFDRNNLFIAELNDFFARIATGKFKAFAKQSVENAYSIIKMCVHEQ